MINLENSLKDKRILIVDDLVEARSALKKMMTTLGCQHIDTATDGREASAFIQEQSYDMVFSDYNLGKGKDGQQVLEEARYTNRLKATSLFVLVTGENAVDMVMGALEYEPDAYITKPFTLNMLRERLTRILNVKNQLRAINQAMDAGKTEKAILQAELLLAEQPKLLMPITRILGKLYIRQQRFNDAIKVYSQLLNVRSVSWARLGQAICLHHLGDSDSALALLKQNLQKHPMYVQCYDWAARILQSLGDYPQAQEQLEKAIEISPKAVLRQIELGKLACQNKDFVVAEAAFEQAIRLGRHSCYKSSKNYLQFAHAVQHHITDDHSRANKNRIDKAFRVIEELRQDYAGETEVMFETSIVEGKTYVSTNNSDGARQSANRAEELLDQIEQPDANQQLLMTEAYIDTGQHVKAKKLMRKLKAEGLDDNHSQRLKDLEGNLNEVAIREYTADLNSQGVEAYEKGLLVEAIDAFDNATSYEEAGISVLLNSIQAKISYIEDQKMDIAQLKDCYQLFKRIGPMGESDERYARYNKLKQTYGRLKRAAGI
ncbi:response regulator [Bacterioplanoides sp.]|uniref:response regulator n=1 Tax=Bacterioplanoides sp. TaxID=2066072 RepID=UPI003B000398